MATTNRFLPLLLAAFVACAAPDAEAKKQGRGKAHGHGRHHGWVQSRAYTLRAWVRRVAHATPQRRNDAASRQATRARDAAERRAVALAEEARRAQRRRDDVAAYVRAHPPVALR